MIEDESLPKDVPWGKIINIKIPWNLVTNNGGNILLDDLKVKMTAYESRHSSAIKKF